MDTNGRSSSSMFGRRDIVLLKSLLRFSYFSAGVSSAADLSFEAVAKARATVMVVTAFFHRRRVRVDCGFGFAAGASALDSVEVPAAAAAAGCGERSAAAPVLSCGSTVELIAFSIKR